MLFILFIVVQCISLGQVQSCTPTSPDQLRVALRGTNGVTISWKTSSSTDTPSPQVTYGTSSTLVGAALSSVGTNSDYGSGSFFHNVGLFNLSSSTTYYYQTVATSCALQSSILSFTTPPAAGNSNAINITLVADLGLDNSANGNSASRTMNGLLNAAKNTHFFIHSGDITYADDTPGSYESIWNTWQTNMTKLTANNIYMTGPGNHEATCNQVGDWLCFGSNSKFKNFTSYLNRFRMPGDESGGYKNMWYSFTSGIVHVVIINTETDFQNAPSGPGSSLNGGNFQGLTQQLAWFAADLQAANASRAQVPWIIVTGHRPFYGSIPTPVIIPGNCDACRIAFDSIMRQYNVDFYFAGHVHWYERLYPIAANGTKLASNYNNQPGPIYVTNGAGGAAEGKGTVSSTNSASAKLLTTFGYARLELQNASNARLSFIDSSNQTVTDSVNITRYH